MTRILVISKQLVRWNGASKVAYELSKQFQKNHEVRLLVYHDCIDSVWEDELDIYKLKHKGVLAFREIRQQIAEYKPDIIHSHDWLGLLALDSSIPQIATVHSNWPMNWFFSPTNFVAGFIQEIPNDIKLHLVDKVISVSKYQQRKLASRGIESKVIYNGVNEEFFRGAENKIKLNHPAILFVGSIDNRKAKYLIPIIKKINSKREKIYFYILGNPTDNKIVKQIKLLDNAIYLGRVDNIIPYYYESDALLFISRQEACPLVILEAKACGLPVFAFDICSNRELIRDGIDGFILNKGDIKGMVEAIINLVNGSITIDRQLIKQEVETLLWGSIAREYLASIRDIASDK
ncbi:MAG: glycosyltransferase family 4 protein [Caldisericales bacterium]|nr:glycosyltransferase family 4 protein [Caldisericales bacterium]